MITWEYVISQLPKTFKCSNCKSEIEVSDYTLREPKEIPYHDILGNKRFVWEYDVLPSVKDEREYVAYWKCPHCNHINYINTILLQHYNKIADYDNFINSLHTILQQKTKLFEIYIIEENENRIKMSKIKEEIPLSASYIEIPSEVLEVLSTKRIKKIQVEKSAITFVCEG
jgi:transcription elongation factor Elf1